MVNVKTAKERQERKLEERINRDKEIMARFNENRKIYSLSDAVIVTANEFNLSVPTLYNIRKRNS